MFRSRIGCQLPVSKYRYYSSTIIEYCIWFSGTLNEQGLHDIAAVAASQQQARRKRQEKQWDTASRRSTRIQSNVALCKISLLLQLPDMAPLNSNVSTVQVSGNVVCVDGHCAALSWWIHDVTCFRHSQNYTPTSGRSVCGSFPRYSCVWISIDKEWW